MSSVPHWAKAPSGDISSPGISECPARRWSGSCGTRESSRQGSGDVGAGDGKMRLWWGHHHCRAGTSKVDQGIRAVHEEHLLWVSTACTGSQMDMRVDRHMDGHVEVGELSLTGEEGSWSLGWP